MSACGLLYQYVQIVVQVGIRIWLNKYPIRVVGLFQDTGLYFESTVSCNPVADDFLDHTLYSV